MFLDYEISVSPQLTGRIWKILICLGDIFNAGQTLRIIEPMKMAFHIPVLDAGTVAKILCNESGQEQDFVLIDHSTCYYYYYEYSESFFRLFT